MDEMMSPPLLSSVFPSRQNRYRIALINTRIRTYILCFDIQAARVVSIGHVSIFPRRIHDYSIKHETTTERKRYTDRLGFANNVLSRLAWSLPFVRSLAYSKVSMGREGIADIDNLGPVQDGDTN